MLLCPFARNSFIGPPRSASLKVLVTLTKKKTLRPTQGKTPRLRPARYEQRLYSARTPYSLCQYPHAAHSPQIACSGALPPSLARRHARLGGSLDATEEWNSASPLPPRPRNLGATLYCGRRRERRAKRERKGKLGLPRQASPTPPRHWPVLSP
jgi:hypothetical protein